MSALLTWCLGGINRNHSRAKVVPHDVTKVTSGVSKSKVVKSFEAELTKAAESKDFHRLERAVNEAASSGLLSKSHVLQCEQTRLQKWKEASSHLQSLLHGNNISELQEAIKIYKELSLLDTEGLLDSATAVMQIAQRREILQCVTKRADISEIESAIRRCEEMETLSLKNEIEVARELLEVLLEEEKLIAANPSFPEQELERAIEAGKVKWLREALQRWKRLKLNLNDPVFVEGTSVLQELLKSKQRKVTARLAECVRRRDLKRAKHLVHKAKTYEVPQAIVTVMESQVITSLERDVTYTDDVIRALRDQDDQQLSQLASSANGEIQITKPSKPTPNGSGEMLETVKATCSCVTEHTRAVTRAVQNVVRPYRVCTSAVDSTELRLREVSRQLSELARKFGDFPDDDASPESLGCLRDDSKANFDRSPMLDEVRQTLADATEKLSKTAEVSRASIRSLNNARLQSLKKVLQLEGASTESTPGNVDGSYAIVQEAELAVEVCNRYINMIRAEKTLKLFLSTQDDVKSGNEVEKVAANLQEGLNALTGLPELVGKNVEIPNQQKQYLDEIHSSLGFMFPQQMFENLKKSAGVRLAEIRISRLESESKENSARYDLHRALLANNEAELVKALKDTSLPNHDPAVVEIEERLEKIRNDKRLCLDEIRSAISKGLESGIELSLSLSRELYISPVHPLVLRAQRELSDIKFRKLRTEDAKQGLALALESKNIRSIREAIARANSCQVLAGDTDLKRAREFVDERSAESNEMIRLRHESVEIAAQVISNNLDENFIGIGDFPTPGSKVNRAFPPKSLGECLVEETENIAKRKDVDSAYKLITKITHLVTEESRVDPEALEEGRKALAHVDEQRNLAKKLKVKLLSAVALDSIDELAAAITEVESSIEVLDYLPGLQHDAFLRLLADAREALALLHERQRNEDGDLKLKQIAAARHQLKKALLTEETNSQPLREAVNAFRMVCLPDRDEESLLNEAEKRTRDEKVVVDEKTSNLIRRSGRKERRSLGFRKSQSARQERSFVDTKQTPRPKTARPERTKSLGPSILSSTNAWEIQKSALRQSQSQNIIALNGSDRKITKTVRFETAKVEARGRRKASNNPRPHSAATTRPASRVSRTRQAWGVQDSKNITLLRKAEKSLQRVELLETKRQLETESNVLWEKLKLGLVGKLKEAINRGDRADLWQALCEFQRYYGDGDLSKDEKLLLNTAQEMLRKRTAEQYVDNLKTALKQRNVETLEHLLYQIDNESEDHLPKNGSDAFRDDVEKARALIKQLSDLRKYRSAILAMSRQLVSEIHSFQSPPDDVKASILATFLLLGENERKINDWTALHALMGKLGRLSVTRRVALCDPSSVPLSTARRVVFVLRDVTYDRIQKINRGACTFYCWANCMAHEVLARKGGEDTRTSAKPNPKEKLLPKRIDIEFWSRLARPSDRRTAEQNFREKMSSRNRMNRAKSAVTVKAYV